MTIGYKIRQYRIEKGMSQEDIIRQLGISRQTLSAWENDRNLPDIISLIRLSEIFETTVDDLVQSEKTDDNTKEETEAIYYRIQFYQIPEQNH